MEKFNLTRFWKFDRASLTLRVFENADHYCEAVKETMSPEFIAEIAHLEGDRNKWLSEALFDYENADPDAVWGFDHDFDMDEQLGKGYKLSDLTLIFE